MTIKSFRLYILESKEKKHQKGILYDFIHFRHVNKDEDIEEGASNLTEAPNPATQYFKSNDNAHLGKTSESISKSLHKNNNFTKEHDDAIKAYSGHHEGNDGKDRKSWYSYRINNALAKGKSVAKKYGKIVKGLDSAISNNRISKKIGTYSGTSFDPRTKLDNKGKMTSPAYISTTHHKGISKDFAYRGRGGNYNPVHIMHFHLEPGDHASHISRNSHFGKEHETIIARNTTLQHQGTDSHYDHQNEHWVHVHHFGIAK